MNEPAVRSRTRLQRAGFWIAYSDFAVPLWAGAALAGAVAVASAAIFRARPLLSSIFLAIGIFLFSYVRLVGRLRKKWIWHRENATDGSQDTFQSTRDD